MDNKVKPEIRVGIFVIAGIILISVAILTLGKSDNFFSSKVKYVTSFKSVEGLIEGSKVILEGVPVGVVEKIEFDNKNRKIQVTLSVLSSSAEWIRKDSVVEISTLGVLGDKYISLHAGSIEEPQLEPNSEIAVRPTKDISHFLGKSDTLIIHLNEAVTNLSAILSDFRSDRKSETFFKNITTVSKNLSQVSDKLNSELDHLKIKKSLQQVNEILEKVNNGTGTLGQLVNDPGLYDQFKALMGGANRNRVIRNLIRQTIKNSESSHSEKN